MRYSCGLLLVIGAVLSTVTLAGSARGVLAGEPLSRSLRQTFPSDQPGTEAPTPSALSPSEIETGFQGHFACRNFSGLNRQLAAAVSDRQVARVPELLKAGADINARSEASHTRGMTLLQTAVFHRWGSDCVQLLIDAGAKVEARDDVGNTALIYACQNGPDPQVDVVELLVKGGAKVNSRGARE